MSVPLGGDDTVSVATLKAGGNGALALVENQLVSGFFPNKIPNPDLKWERTGQFDIGLDLGLFNNRCRT